MPEILQLRGTFQRRPSGGRPGLAKIPKNASAISAEHLRSLVRKLESVQTYWSGQTILSGELIDVYYCSVVAKSNRISSFFSKGPLKANDSIRGARFIGTDRKKHVVTHYVTEDIVLETIERLNTCIEILNNVFNGAITAENLENINDSKIDFDSYGLPKSIFCATIADAHYVEDFKVPNNPLNSDEQSLVTVYETDDNLTAVMRKVGFELRQEKIIGETTMLLNKSEIDLLKNNASYMIAMSVEDMSTLSIDDIIASNGERTVTIPSPQNEPIIGVIDTMFDDRVYFSEWVDFRRILDPNIPVDPNDDHGTAVSSIIVDGPTINPDLDDGCGKFRVRLFGVASGGRYSSFSIMRMIEKIIQDNPDIRVWNLSLGSENEVNENSISPEAAVLDRLQFDYDIVFVVAGTNKPSNSNITRVGSPADSINSLVVNSITRTGTPASYSREGIVLSFFNKPDVSSHGGDGPSHDYIRVCTGTGESFRTGTSYAAPWVTRKLAYLIEVLGLNREVAKALLVDAAAGWDDTGNDEHLAPLIGHGAVPIHIDDVIKSQDNEIKFIVSDVTNMYETYTYGLPVPIQNDKYPFVAKATLCYFPRCSVNQGVDYTNTELDAYIGRVGKNGIKSIDKNAQSVTDGERHYITEPEARRLFRKWDNTKHIREAFGDRIIPRKVYDSGMWGVSVKLKSRFDGERPSIRFGLVVTLKEINGVNRINDFIRQCELRGWLVSKVDVNNRVEIYNRSQEHITFDS